MKESWGSEPCPYERSGGFAGKKKTLKLKALIFQVFHFIDREKDMEQECILPNITQLINFSLRIEI